MKHERDIRPEKRPAWRLKKTLARQVSFRPIEHEDLRYVWAAYKKGALASMGEKFAGGEMDRDAFVDAIEAEIQVNYHGAWTLFADAPRRGVMPVGLVLGFYSHPNPAFAPFMIVGDMVWFPWASPRNRIESAVGFFRAIHAQVPMVEYARAQHRRFFEMIAKHGVMRRVGTSFNVYPGEATAVFETRSV